MNFLAHLYLAGDEEGLRLGAMLGDFVRGKLEHSDVPQLAHRGILLHRHIDQYIDSLPEVGQLRELFPRPFRRYSGIIIDLAFDHELAQRWGEYCSSSLEQFDRGVRAMLGRHADHLPAELKQFMRYADRHGLFAAYREEREIMASLRGVGQRLSRANPLHRVSEIWEELKPELGRGFTTAFPLVRRSVGDWLTQPAAATVS